VIRYTPDLNAEAQDDYTLDIICKTACPLLVSVAPQLTFSSPDWERNNPTQVTRKNVGTGTYKFVEWRAGEFLKYDVFPEYYGPKPSIPEVTYLWRAEATVRAAMLTTGEAHMAPMPITEEKNVPKLVGSASPDTLFIRFRARMDPKWEGTAGVQLRQALVHAVDCEAIVRTLLAGKTQCRAFPFDPSSVGYPKNVTPYTYDPAKARQLLKDTGNEGLSIQLPSRTGRIDLQLLEAIAGYWREVGLQARVVQVEADQANAYQRLGVENKPPDMYITGHTNDIFDASVTVPYIDGCESALSYVKCDPAITAKIKQAGAASGVERDRLFQELMTYWHEQAFALTLWAEPQTYGAVQELEWKPRFDQKVRVDTMRFTK
jgi:peptide/nickel transport system substrate-binding protein